jgi:hypothetical protein
LLIARSLSKRLDYESSAPASAAGYARGMREIFKGFLMLRLLAFIPLSIVIVALLGVSALTRGSEALGIAILAGAPVVAVAALGWFAARRAGERRR